MSYWQDDRTETEMIQDYRYGKKAEDIIVQRLEWYFWIEKSNKTDTEWEFDKYAEDVLIWYWDMEWKVEIKFTKQLLKYVQWKENQYNYAQINKVNLLQVSGWKIAWIPHYWKGYYIEKWYCNKPTYSFKPVWMESFEELREYLIW